MFGCSTCRFCCMICLVLGLSWCVLRLLRVVLSMFVGSVGLLIVVSDCVLICLWWCGCGCLFVDRLLSS